MVLLMNGKKFLALLRIQNLLITFKFEDLVKY